MAKLCLTPGNLMDWSTPGFLVLHYLLEFAQIHVSWVSENHLICFPLLLLPSVFLSIRVFSNELALHIRWPKYWSFSFVISPFNEYSELISFRIDWFYPLDVEGTLKSLLQYHSSKGSILQCSAFFTVQLSHSYMTTGKTIALTRWTFVGKVMSLLFNILSSLVTAFLPRSKRLLISWLQSPSAVILLDCIPAHSSTQVEIPTRSSALLRSQPSGLRELSYQFSLIWIPSQQTIPASSPV